MGGAEPKGDILWQLPYGSKRTQRKGIMEKDRLIKALKSYVIYVKNAREDPNSMVNAEAVFVAAHMLKILTGISSADLWDTAVTVLDDGYNEDQIGIEMYNKFEDRIQ